jgi:hypothetical protein
MEQINMHHAFNEMLYASSMAYPAASTASAITLPLTLLLQIVSLLDDMSDLSRVARTSRLLHYITLPLLYRRVCLRSRGSLQTAEGRRSGYGGPSPLNMALQVLVTGHHASLVKHFELTGTFDEPRQDDFLRGRVPEKTMFLSILVGVAVEKMTTLESFAWHLDCKPQKTVYQALTQLESLTKLSLRFPANRQSCNVCTIPPMPNLTTLVVQSIDASCSPDDISLLLLRSPKLEDLRLNFSPHLRREAQPSFSLGMMFRRCLQAGHKLNLRHFALQNAIVQDMAQYATMSRQLFGDIQLHSECYFDCFGGYDGDPRTAFADDIWQKISLESVAPARHVRVNEVAPEYVRLGRSRPQTIESFIIVSEREFGMNAPDAPRYLASSSTSPSSLNHEIVALTESYIEMITQFHGLSIRRLLLPDRFVMTVSQIQRLVQFCPKLEQLGCGLDFSDRNVFHLLLPFLKHLRAVRILSNSSMPDELCEKEQQRWSREMAQDSRILESPQLSFVGVGSTVYRIGQATRVVSPAARTKMQRKVEVVSKADVQHIEIWGLDNLDISLGGIPDSRSR